MRFWIKLEMRKARVLNTIHVAQFVMLSLCVSYWTARILIHSSCLDSLSVNLTMQINLY